MSIHYGQRVEVYLDTHAAGLHTGYVDEAGWFPGTTDSHHGTGHPHGTIRVNLDPDGKRFIYADPFYIRPLEDES